MREPTTRHVSDEQAARWVSGLLETEEAARVESHVATCKACEQVLQREASAEMVMLEAIASSASLRRRTNVVSLSAHRRRVVAVFASLTAAAAALVLVLAQIEKGEALDEVAVKPAAAPLMTFTVLEPTSEPGGPTLELKIPRYEEGLRVPDVDVVAREPFPL